MVFEKYWNSVKNLSPRIGSLYILSKIVFGIGLGILLSTIFTKINLLFLGIIITLLGILLMMPAELKIIKFLKNKE